MALEYTYPRVAIIEARKRPRATNIGSLSTIGVVGSFAQGPKNQPVAISSIDELIERFGEDGEGLTGHAFIQAAMAQGANDFVVVRAAGVGDAQPEDADYTAALATLENEKVAIVACAGQSGTTIHNALLTHVNTATLLSGLRVAVLTLDSGLTRQAAITAKGALASPRALLGYLHQKVDGDGTLWAPDGYLAGILATNAPNQSPSNVIMAGTLGPERKLSDADLSALAEAFLVPVGLEPQGGVAALTGTMLDGTPISERRMLDQISMDLFRAVQWAKSRPMIEDDRPGVVNVKRALEDQVDDYLQGMVARGWLDAYLPTEAVRDTTKRTWRVLIRPKLTVDGDFIDLVIEH